MWMNEMDIDDAVRDYGDRQDPLGEAVRALEALKDATNRNSDGWPYYSKASRAGARLAELVRPAGWNPWAGDRHPEVTRAQLASALTPVKAFRTRRDWKFDLTDAERAATAATAAREADADREARTQAMARKFAPLLSGQPDAEELAAKLAELAVT